VFAARPPLLRSVEVVLPREDEKVVVVRPVAVTVWKLVSKG
jgi:hypothetical protein